MVTLATLLPLFLHPRRICLMTMSLPPLMKVKMKNLSVTGTMTLTWLTLHLDSYPDTKKRWQSRYVFTSSWNSLTHRCLCRDHCGCHNQLPQPEAFHRTLHMSAAKLRQSTSSRHRRAAQQMLLLLSLAMSLFRHSMIGPLTQTFGSLQGSRIKSR